MKKYYVFPSEKSACDYLGVAQCTVSAMYNKNLLIRGYRIIRAISEESLYHDDRIYKIWEGMRERCNRENHVRYDKYGGRGIKVRDEWNDYLPFAKWAINNGYSKELSLDRIDNDKGYSPDNCRWVTMNEQQNNRSNNRIVEYDGIKYTLSELARMGGMNKTTLRERLNSNWSVKDAVEKPVRQRTKKQ